jgi:hypothetical protein
MSGIMLLARRAGSLAARTALSPAGFVGDMVTSVPRPSSSARGPSRAKIEAVVNRCGNCFIKILIDVD